MDSKMYPDANIHQGQTPAPPTYDTAMGFHPPPPHVPPMTTTTTHHVVQAPIIIGHAQVGPNPTGYVCPHCRSSILTRVDYEPGTKTHLMALLLCLFGCWCCPCVPYLVNDCKNANHYCPSCGAYIGTYSH